MTWLHGLQRQSIRLTPSQYLGACLALLLAVSALCDSRGQERLSLPHTPVQEISATGDQSPAPTTATNNQLPALLALNRQAAARVALVGLAGGAGRGALARSAADWMGQALASMPQTGDEFTARQRAVLEQWQMALDEYADGRVGSLVQVRAISEANAELYGEMSRINENQKEF